MGRANPPIVVVATDGRACARFIDPDCRRGLDIDTL
jgi:hypothetical protein